MFWNKLERTLRDHPDWEPQLREIASAISGASTGAAVDPATIAQSTGLKLGEVLAFLKVLADESVGRFEIRVLDPRGLEIARFTRLSEVPDRIEDEFGEETEVDPENVELVFRLSEP